MKIQRNILDVIFQNIGMLPPEIGGVLGAENDIVKYVEIDNGLRGKLCSYTPDVDYLNYIIEIWWNKGIDFKGIFHSHYFGVRTLSQGDKNYIQKIMYNMPSDIRYLYFPIAVMPDKELVVYKACKCRNGVIIETQKLEIL